MGTKIKTGIVIASMLVVFVLVSGCMNGDDGTPTDDGAGDGGSTDDGDDSGIIDCGEASITNYESDACILGALATCTPAKIFGDRTGGGTTLTIAGLEGDLCVVEYSVLFEANPAKGILDDRITLARCKYPASVYTTGAFPTDAAIINAHCVDIE